MSKPPKKPKADTRPPLPDFEAELDKAAKGRVEERRQAGHRGPQFTVAACEGKSVKVEARYADNDQAASYRSMDLFATASQEFTSALETQILNAAGVNTSDAGEVERAMQAGHAFIAGQQPQTQTEALFAVQLWAIHCATMRMAGSHARATTLPHLNEYGLQMNRTARTFVALAEGLAKQRSGGKQQVEVRYVYVDARGSQNIIGIPGGGGGDHQNSRQPHEPFAALGYSAPGSPGGAIEAGLPVWSEDAERDALPASGHEREAPLSPARRRQPRSPQGAGERTVSARPAHPRGRGDAA